jgi:GNAT superfamily N-acetyltransferase
MPDATDFARQWAGIVALVRLLGTNAPRATLIEAGGMVASVMPVAPGSSIMNTAVAVDPAAPPGNLEQLAEAFRRSGAEKWGLWVDGEDERAAEVAQRQGMALDSRPAPMVADLDDLPFDDAPPRTKVGLAVVGRVNDLAYGYQAPKLAPAIAALPDTTTTLAYGAHNHASVALAHDIGSDTAVWFVATLPHQQRKGLSGQVLRRLLLDARERRQETASLQASQAGRPLYERLGFTSVGSLHFYEQRFPST